MHPVTTQTWFHKIITSPKNTNTVGYDGVSTKVLKYSKELIASPLVHIMKLCIADGIFPNNLKQVIIKPLYKEDDKTNLKNYRPIAKTPDIKKMRI